MYHAAHSNNIDRDVLVSMAESFPLYRPHSPDLRHQNLHPLRHRKSEYELWKVITKISGDCSLFTYHL
jgi:hypothetical protein